MVVLTADGHKVHLTAHIESPRQLAEIKGCGACGIGLLETKPLEEGRLGPEMEENQLNLFLEAGRASGGKVTVLLPELAPDRSNTCMQGENPALGCHGIRTFLAHPGFYRFWLRALLRAGVQGRYELALPMVSHVTEIIQFKKILNGIRAELEEEGLPHCPPAVGIMVEAPSVAPSIDTIIFESGFFVVGKRFLKYLMADDCLPGGEDDFIPFYHQAFLLQIESLIASMHRRKSNVRFCGPLVKDPVAIPLLVGFGFDEIIAAPEHITGIKKIIQSINYLNARMVASKTTSYWEPGQARGYAEERYLKLIH